MPREINEFTTEHGETIHVEHSEPLNVVKVSVMDWSDSVVCVFNPVEASLLCDMLNRAREAMG